MRSQGFSRRIWRLGLVALLAGCGGNVTRDGAHEYDNGSGNEPASGTAAAAPGGAPSHPGSTSSGGAPSKAGSAALPGDDSAVFGHPQNVPLTPVDGWLSGASNSLAIQGAAFSFADDTTRPSVTENFSGNNACIRGATARVDLACTPVPPAQDCFGVYFGAAIGLNLNQPLDVDGLGGTPLPYDASAIRGFSFEISGADVPDGLRFGVDSAAESYCGMPVVRGENSFTFDQLFKQCWRLDRSHTALEAQSFLVRLTWLVVSNTGGQVPFDFCVSNLVAVPK